MTQEQANPNRRRGIHAFVSNPWTGVLIGAASLFTGVYFYFRSLQSRELTYYVTPVTTIVRQSAAPGSLSVLHDGRPVLNGVSAQQVGFWNNGKLSIRAAEILGDGAMLIRAAGGERILEARLRTQSRPDVTRI